MEIRNNDDITHLFDRPLTLRCPHCTVRASMNPVAVPRFNLLHRFKCPETGIVYACGSCNRAVFVRFRVNGMANPVMLDDAYEMVSTSLEPFEMQYLEGAVHDDFQEALTCYSHSSWNAFAAMCRRCIQSVSEKLGASGTTKVQSQLEDLRAMRVADDETFKQLHEIMLAGHDGAHPHLPSLSADRAQVLLHLMQDVLYQLFVRPAKIRESAQLRQNAIAQK